MWFARLVVSRERDGGGLEFSSEPDAALVSSSPMSDCFAEELRQLIATPFLVRGPVWSASPGRRKLAPSHRSNFTAALAGQVNR